MTIASAAPNFRVQMSTLSGEIPESEGRIVQVHEASSTRFRVTRDNGFTEQYDGSFSYNGGGVSGTIKEASAFTHAFRRWTGKTPSEQRAAGSTGGAPLDPEPA